MNETNRKCLTRRSLLRNGAVATGSLCLPWAIHVPRAAAQNSDAGVARKNWTIENELVKRVVTFHPKTGLFTEQLSALASRVDLVLPGKTGMTQEFSFLCNGSECTGTNGSFLLVDFKEVALPNGRALAVHLRHIQLTLEVTVIYSVYDGHPAVRKHLVLRNTGADPLHIFHLNVESLRVALGPADEITLLTQYGAVPRETFYTGRSEDACLIVANGKTGQGVAVVN